jgi:BRCT domain type II-containing protein
MASQVEDGSRVPPEDMELHTTSNSESVSTVNNKTLSPAELASKKGSRKEEKNKNKASSSEEESSSTKDGDDDVSYHASKDDRKSRKTKEDKKNTYGVVSFNYSSMSNLDSRALINVPTGKYLISIGLTLPRENT